jgi:hypothetical protein
MATRRVGLKVCASALLLVLGLSSRASVGSIGSGSADAGSSPTLDSTTLMPDWSFASGQMQGLAGWVAAAGDVNGDGYADFLVGAPSLADPSYEGRAFLFLGSPSGPSTTPSWSFDCNQAGARCARSLSGAGDVNGDGYDDVLIGAPAYDNGQADEGRAFLFLGSASGLLPTFAWSQEGNQAGAAFGQVSRAGDVNGDGFDDVLVTAEDYNAGNVEEGKAFLYFGSPSGPSLFPSWTWETNQGFATLLAGGVGDVNGDGFDDIAMGSPLYDFGQAQEGKVFLFLGGSSGPGTVPFWTAEGNLPDAYFGTLATRAGDVNADGYDDILIVSERYHNPNFNEGAAFVWVGGPSGKIQLGISGTPSNADWRAEGDQTYSSLQWGGSAGDFDTDGFDDVVVGMPYFEVGAQTVGRILVYRGTASGISLVPSWSADGPASSEFGWTVGGVGDVNGDSAPDILVGAETLTVSQGHEGGAFLFFGSAQCHDLDGDGYGFPGSPSCPGGLIADCNDTDIAIHPGGIEVCNGLDDDCSSATDETVDADGDAFTTCQGDCNDTSPNIHPGAAEPCNGIDDDCDGATDEDSAPDGDGDGFRTCTGDCDDANAAIHPGALELCNGLDDDCSSATDETVDGDGDGSAACGGDCNDTNPGLHPGAAEACNAIDDDCDGFTDEGFPPDVDGDGFRTCNGDCDDGNPAVHPGAIEACNGINDDCDFTTDEGFDLDGDGYTTCGGDCDDTSWTVYPGAPESCNQADDNCDGIIDDGGAQDVDGDGFRSCNGDCNDSAPAIHPGAPELCNQIDDDCDAEIDDGFTDFDTDGFSLCTGDCNDSAIGIHPGAVEACNLADDDCDGVTDEGFDVDADGFTSCGGDCQDGNPAVHPGAPEACNGVDDDCDSLVDNAPDLDSDGVGGCEDCNDGNPMVWAHSVEVQNLALSGPGPTYFIWDDQDWTGPETVYDISTATFGPAFGIIFAAASCLTAGAPAYPYYEDTRPDPAPQTAYWYLVRARNSCGTSHYGTNHLGQLRVLPPCP